MLKCASILICEDEAFIALDIALSVEDAGGVVVGPAATVAEAMKLLKEGKISGAILDVDLADRDITPIATWLLERNIPVVFQTGVGLPEALRRKYPNSPVVLKPVMPNSLVCRMVSMLAERARRPIPKVAL